MDQNYAVYLMASRHSGTLYVGVTRDLKRRVWEHRTDYREGFTSKYAVHRLVWFEMHSDIQAAIAREKAIKKWRRQWKINLIEERNLDWNDLYPSLFGMTQRQFNTCHSGALEEQARNP
ncbi:GIY-YIG nuclease family protein [Parvularcula lutaonensis]|uniref:GIY-YIG nuclease family protein n=1 Tax=Parvularcula lutaonensis TaxID=491923 RepID=A0ABV7M9L7_9PROT|nr:GIY-YIG nuclease family protein [Parvularcula lutaonensis]GGY43627.1 nuclease [Parvularcula lutaonensis]